MAADEDDEDVDSGWEMPAAIPQAALPDVNSNEASTLKAAEPSPAAEEAAPPSQTAVQTVRPAAPSVVSVEKIPRPPPTLRADVPRMRAALSQPRGQEPVMPQMRQLDNAALEAEEDAAPLTRRAQEHELPLLLESESGTRPALGSAPNLDELRTSREPNRSITPVHGNAAKLARKLDAGVHTRPTPPARASVNPPPATPLPPGPALRFSAEGLDKARKRGRAETKVNLSLAELAKANLSDPALDLHLEDFDLAAGPQSEPQRRQSTPPIDELDDLPVSEMIESARPSSLPRRSSFPLPLVHSPTTKPAALETARQAGAPPASGDNDDLDLDPYNLIGRPTLPVALIDAEVSIGDEVGLSEEEEAALNEEFALDSVGAISREADSLAVTAEAPAAAALAALLAAEPAPDSVDAKLEVLRLRFEKGDFTGVLMRAEGLLETHPDCAPAKRLVEACQARLKDTYKSRLGSGSEVLRVMMRPDEIQGLSLDHRAGFLMSLCDGVSTLDEIVDMSGMSELDVLRLLFEMREQGVVAIAGNNGR